ncbi:spore germination protein KB [Sporobacter termitidis DSM 10068]|uniref:Spore germination protein KB n=1 Tax=Sporobacter termitidis DSM 10068 TaxID=1123282 RepID=A0A1M5VIH1_9FIRM|nr:endospore germination permease [Sporobacter termitidis]SHH74990.1 spore germination protein KB [Sporobacter termitidis DSM 10068]
MDDKIITNHQLFTFTGLSLLGGSLLVISASVAGVAKQDAWISPLIVLVLGILMMCLYGYLGTRYEGLTLVGICQRIFGKWLGKIVGACYFIFIFTTTYGIPWWIGNFGTHVMSETPVPIIILPYAAALVIAVYYGIEAIVRMSELAYIFVTVLFVLSIVLVLPNARIEYMKPILENGIAPVLKGVCLLLPFIVFPGIVLLMFFPRHASDVSGGKKAIIKGFVWCGSVVFITVLVSGLVLGNDVVAKSSFPTLQLATEINVGTLLTRFEYAISSIWTVTEFMVGIFFFYSSVTSLAELIGLKDHKKIAMPLGFIVLLLAWIVYPNTNEQLNWVNVGYTPEVTLFGFILPVIMVIVYQIKKVFNR